ncbi:MAG: quinolinate synthase [Deltaproteobacteria bacterium HGW-Deltaproteobacteria-1]|nr:MAG: quinolinate synthase [Deltaproteobacteria bacterium HGW-Deltaproteobacteria-1]
MDLVEKIHRLKKEKNAVILAHNYQLPEVQDIADYVGDSLGLSIQASKTNADIIVFCGVYFMAETAKILSPEKMVLIPDRKAGCPMKDDEIIFVPDQYLAHYISTKVGRDFILWKGYCPTHVKMLPEDIALQRTLHKDAEVIVHPECPAGITSIADKVLSTEGMCNYIKASKAREFIIGTEIGIIHRLQKENPGKLFYPLSERATCPNMKRTTLEKVLWSLEELGFEVTVPPDIMNKARTCLQRMIDYKP